MRARRRHLLHTEGKCRDHMVNDVPDIIVTFPISLWVRYERAAMPSTVTYMPMLNSTNYPVICMPFYKHTLCKFNNGWLVKLLVVCSAPLLPRPSAASAIANFGQMSTHTLPVWDGQPAKMTDRWFSHSVEPILLYQFENTRYKQCGVP